MAKAGKNEGKLDADLERAWGILTDEARLRARAASILQTFLASESASGSEWRWEAYVAELFELPLEHPAVERLAARIRAQERPNGRINYATPAKARDFIGRLEQHAYPAFQGPT